MRKNLFLLCLPFALAANPVFNGSFELGTDGFALEQELRTDLNKELKFHPLKTASAAPGEGKQSLEVENPYAEYYNLFSKDFRLKPSTQYEFSVKMKSSVPGDPVYFGVFKVDPVWSAHAKTFSASKEWKTYTFRFTTEPKEGWYHILIRGKTEPLCRNPGFRFRSASQNARLLLLRDWKIYGKTVQHPSGFCRSLQRRNRVSDGSTKQSSSISRIQFFIGKTD